MQVFVQQIYYNLETKVLTKRENITLERINNAQRSAVVLKALIKMGFKNFPTVVAITQHYYPDTSRDVLFNFWHFRAISSDMVEQMEKLCDILKSE